MITVLQGSRRLGVGQDTLKPKVEIVVSWKVKLIIGQAVVSETNCAALKIRFDVPPAAVLSYANVVV
jgi:hypothetical protein